MFVCGCQSCDLAVPMASRMNPPFTCRIQHCYLRLQHCALPRRPSVASNASWSLCGFDSKVPTCQPNLHHSSSASPYFSALLNTRRSVQPEAMMPSRYDSYGCDRFQSVWQEVEAVAGHGSWDFIPLRGVRPSCSMAGGVSSQ